LSAERSSDGASDRLRTGLRSRARWFAVALAAVCSMAGCNTYSAPAAPGTLNFLIESAPINLDPRFGLDAQSQDLDGLLFSSLVAHDAHMNIIPDAAQSWDTPDPLTVIFHLHPGIKFHDGRPLTSEDVKYTFDTILNGTPNNGTLLRSPKRGTFASVASIEARDPLTVVFHLSKPDGTLLWNMSRPAVGIVPKGSGTDLRQHPIGSGPFQFVSMVTDEEVDLDRNNGYFAPQAAVTGNGELVQHIRFRVVPDAVVRALELRKGSADIGGVNALTPDMAVALERDPNLSVQDQPGTSLTYIAFNFSDPILAHPEVRHALDFATDRASMVKYLYRDQARLANGLLPPDNWASDPNIPVTPYDPAEAEKLLDAAGFPRGPDGIRIHLTLKSSTEEVARTLGETLADQWKRVGVALELRPLENATLQSDIGHGSFQLYTLRWLGANNDPGFFQYVFNSSMMPPNGANRGHYVDPALDALLAQYASDSDRAAQKATAWQMEAVIAKDEPYLNLWVNDVVCVHRKRVTNIDLSPTGDYNFLERVMVR
jgi:peptide/nickel transport system substrate-binding protein